MNSLTRRTSFVSRRSSWLAATSAVVLAFATPTFAADLDIKPTSESWTGVYVGAAVGAGAGSTTLDAGSGVFELDGIGAEGVLWSAALGYDYQVNARWVVGGMLDYTGSSIETTLGGSITGTGSAGYDLTADHAFSILGRAGYLTGPDTLVYGLAGYTRQYYSGGLFVSGLGSTSYEFDTGGLTVGAGIENRIGNNMSVKLEYRYTDFDDVDIIPTFLGTDTVSHTVRLGLNYKFGMEGGAEPEMSAIAYDWTGFLIGIEAGLGANVTSFDINAGPLNADFTGLSGEGGTIGLRVGYDHQINDTWVVGAQFAGRLTNMDVEAELNLGGGAAAAIDEQYQFALTGRVGYLTTPDTMWYALAGYQWSSIDFNVLGATLGSIDREGFVVGAGVETALTENLSIGLEYRYVDYNDVDIIGAGVADALTSSHTGMLSLNYKFRP